MISSSLIGGSCLGSELGCVGCIGCGGGPQFAIGWPGGCAPGGAYTVGVPGAAIAGSDGGAKMDCWGWGQIGEMSGPRIGKSLVGAFGWAENSGCISRFDGGAPVALFTFSICLATSCKYAETVSGEAWPFGTAANTCAIARCTVSGAFGSWSVTGGASQGCHCTSAGPVRSGGGIGVQVFGASGTAGGGPHLGCTGGFGGKAGGGMAPHGLCCHGAAAAAAFDHPWGCPHSDHLVGSYPLPPPQPDQAPPPHVKEPVAGAAGCCQEEAGAVGGAFACWPGWAAGGRVGTVGTVGAATAAAAFAIGSKGSKFGSAAAAAEHQQAPGQPGPAPPPRPPGSPGGRPPR